MNRPFILLLLLVTLAAWAQEPDDVEPDPTEAQPEEAADEATEEAPDEVDFSDELYTEEEDAFIPSENVKFGQSIPFPTDI